MPLQKVSISPTIRSLVSPEPGRTAFQGPKPPFQPGSQTPKFNIENSPDQRAFTRRLAMCFQPIETVKITPNFLHAISARDMTSFPRPSLMKLGISPISRGHRQAVEGCRIVRFAQNFKPGHAVVDARPILPLSFQVVKHAPHCYCQSLVAGAIRIIWH